MKTNRRNKQNIVIFVYILLCISCYSSETNFWATLIEPVKLNYNFTSFTNDQCVGYDENGYIVDAFLEPFKYTENSEIGRLAQIIERVELIYTNVSIDINLIERDLTPVVNPSPKILSKLDMLKLLHSDNFKNQKKHSNFETSENMSIHDSIHFVLSPRNGVTVKGEHSHKEHKLTFTIGPKEYTRDYERRVYKVPDELVTQMSKLPDKLKKTGKTFAYNKDLKILVVIDEGRSSIFNLLDLIGLEEINKKPKLEYNGRINEYF